MKAKSINRQPPIWEKTYGESIKVYFLNIHSLRDKIDDVKADPMIYFGDILVFAETWLENDDANQFMQIDSYSLHLNSIAVVEGRGLQCILKITW